MPIGKTSVLLAACAAMVSTAAAGERAGGMRPPGDPEKAVESEYAALAARGTREALELFIARHPDHPLSERARAAIERMGRRPPE